MDIRPLPDTKDDVTPAFLTDALAQSPAWTGGRVTAVTGFEAMDSPRGTAYRASIACDSGPLDLMVKMHNPAIPEARRDNYAGEAYFYKEVASRSGVPVPDTYIAEWDPDGARQLIVQEFLSDGHIGTMSTMLDRPAQERVLDVLATMHARWWNSPDLDDLTGIKRTDSLWYVSLRGFEEAAARDGQNFLDSFEDRLHPQVADYYRSPDRRKSERLRDGFSPHITLCHYDISAKNIFIPTDPARAPVLFDWGLVVKGHPGVEIAQLLGASTHPSRHHELPDLVRHYHDRLTAHGVTDYLYDALWNDFRRGLLIRLVAPAALHARNNPAATALALAILPPFSGAALATDAFELREA